MYCIIDDYSAIPDELWIRSQGKLVTIKLRRPRSCAPEVYEMVNRLKLEDWPHDM